MMKNPFSKSVSHSGPGFRTVVLRHYRATFGRFEFALNVTTKAALKLDADAAEYNALKARAVEVAGEGRQAWVQWGLDDIWDAEGGHPRREAALAYLQHIIDTGEVPNMPKDDGA